MIKLEDKLYTSTEVADILGVSLRSVYRYIEEGKLNAEVKTATGRHRFTKQNIVDFLYPNGEETAEETAARSTKTREAKPTEVAKAERVEEHRVEKLAEESKETKETEKKTEVAAETEEKKEEEPVDWLAKFREAAKKFEEERATAQKKDEPKVEAPVEQPAAEPKQADEAFQGLAGIVEPEQSAPEVEPTPANQMFYFRSRLGGLKDIAQNIDKSSRNSSVDYAFTLNAGLSLFKPIKPFSVLHAYVRSKDREFFERVLMLVPSDESNAQLCLVVSDDANVYDYKAEIHGLSVVSKQQLLDDVKSFGDPSLMSEAESVLK